MEIKVHTFVKGLVWEALGVLTLFGYTWLATGNVKQATTIGFGYPVLRTVLWYPFERLFKRARRWKQLRGSEYEHCDKQPLLIECEAPLFTISRELTAEAATNDEIRKFIHLGVDEYIDNPHFKRKHTP